MRKFLVKLFNLIYIAAAGISIYALCTRPVFKASIKVHFSQEKMGEVLSKAFNKGSGSSEESSEVRLVYRESPKMSDFLTPEKVQGYFPNGYDLKVDVQIPAQKAFQIHNTKLIDELLQENLYSVIDKVVESVNQPLHEMFKDIFKGYAVDILKEQITEQIMQYFPGGDEATEAEVAAVFENVYSLLDGDEPVTVDNLADVILHGVSDGEGGTTGSVLDIINARGAKYSLWSPQPSEEEVTADISAAEGEEKYFVVDEISYIHNTNSYNSGTSYFAKGSGDEFVLCDPQPTEEAVNTDKNAVEEEGVYFVQKVTYKHNTEAYDSSVSYYKKTAYTNEDINEDKITDAMVEELEKVDGLVSTIATKCDPQPSQTDVENDIAKPEKDRIYYILNSNGDPVLPESYDPSAEYYTVQKVVNDIDSAMATLIDSFLNGSSSNSSQQNESEESRAVIRAEEAKEAQDEDSLKQTLKEYLLNMLPANISEKTGQLGTYAPYILLGLIVLFALPWAWFAFVTLIRTLRKDKCWTRPGIIIFGALLQVVLGLVLTYGAKYFWPYIADRVEALKDFANAVNFDIRTGCLIPSFVYLGVLAMTIPYLLLRAPLKRKWKWQKRYSRSQSDYYDDRLF